MKSRLKMLGNADYAVPAGVGFVYRKVNTGISLRDCPFCGQMEDGSPTAQSVVSVFVGTWAVRCFGCGAYGPPSDESPEKAAHLWNGDSPVYATAARGRDALFAETAVEEPFGEADFAAAVHENAIGRCGRALVG